MRIRKNWKKNWKIWLLSLIIVLMMIARGLASVARSARRQAVTPTPPAAAQPVD